MKRIQTFSFILLFLILQINVSAQYGRYGNQLVGDELLNISGEAAEETAEIQGVVNELFQSIEMAIQETNQIAEDLIQAEQSGEKLSKQTKETIKTRIEKIHEVYSNINQNESYHKSTIQRSAMDAKEIVQQTDRILKREGQEYNEVVDQIKRIGTVSPNDERYDELRALKTKKNLRNIIVQTLTEFNNEIKNFESNHTVSQDRIDNFFKQVGYSKEVTALMIEVLDLSIKVDMIKENVKALQEIDKYTKEMYESLDNLSRSLESLKEIAREYQ